MEQFKQDRMALSESHGSEGEDRFRVVARPNGISVTRTIPSPPQTQFLRPAIRKAMILAVLTILASLFESTSGLYFGAAEHSVALFGFGLDSLAELGSAAMILWRFSGWEKHAQFHAIDRERRATGMIGILLVSFGLSVIVNSLHHLVQHAEPIATLPGILISATSLTMTTLLWFFKKRTARQLDSSSVLKDAGCSWACMTISMIVLLSCFTYRLFPQVWWLDGVAGALLGIFICHEGREAFAASRRPEFKGGCGCVH